MTDTIAQWACLNYWLNNELKNWENNAYKPSVFYRILKNNDLNNSNNLNICMDKIKDIGENLLINMQTLSRLYDLVGIYNNNYFNTYLKHCTHCKKCVELY